MRVCLVDSRNPSPETFESVALFVNSAHQDRPVVTWPTSVDGMVKSAKNLGPALKLVNDQMPTSLDDEEIRMTP
jgi:hypothetical protein